MSATETRAWAWRRFLLMNSLTASSRRNTGMASTTTLGGFRRRAVVGQTPSTIQARDAIRCSRREASRWSGSSRRSGGIVMVKGIVRRRRRIASSMLCCGSTACGCRQWLELLKEILAHETRRNLVAAGDGFGRLHSSGSLFSFWIAVVEAGTAEASVRCPAWMMPVAAVSTKVSTSRHSRQRSSISR